MKAYELMAILSAIPSGNEVKIEVDENGEFAGVTYSPPEEYEED